jgi:hypothetical protein
MVKNVSNSVWIKAGELKFCMNMLYFFKNEIVCLNLEFFEIHLSCFLKNPDICLKKCQKFVEELKCCNELFNNVFKAFSFLKFREVHFGTF